MDGCSASGLSPINFFDLCTASGKAGLVFLKILSSSGVPDPQILRGVCCWRHMAAADDPAGLSAREQPPRTVRTSPASQHAVSAGSAPSDTQRHTARRLGAQCSHQFSTAITITEPVANGVQINDLPKFKPKPEAPMCSRAALSHSWLPSP